MRPGGRTDKRSSRRPAAAAVLFGLFTALTVVHPAEARPEEPPPVYELQLVYVFESSETEFLFLIGNSGFKTVESLESFLATRPPGTTLKWSPGCVRVGGEPLLSSESDMESFHAFCREHRIDFVLVPSG
ncbi:MAG TPA: hypothetical protein VGK86_14200 [Thermoanaerobaculia bacterium]|jgi:hypothetical protein